MIVLILGSGPNVLSCRDWPRADFDRVLAINNAWAVRPDWDYLVFPDDFPPDRLPPKMEAGQTLVRSAEYVPHNNSFGGIIYAGATMAFSAGYWALGALRPQVLAYLGCDMVYSQGQTHFYGTGTADPLRPDPTLQNLRAKSARLELLAAQAGCATVNLSQAPSALTFPRVDPVGLKNTRLPDDPTAHIAAALAAETALNAVCPSGRYWDGPPLDAGALAQIDGLWLDAYAAATATRPSVQPLRY
ncbi:MAG: hypothetical protein HLUCCA05_10130 [Roseibaca calidilacus]|uniref:Uncharacterized protein n=1 Tax=Roseibaca calidilacus TaxID=1666912 RepID=A0A0P7YR13_9RHOB|nr:hypothetical protein [Roseibaca calidilacus]KPP92743.1 MAG: hypothetical protein HLUCCA05_10130 [Roseibaca calidilacus]CUX80184.1 hypothetical protein Ga0058931_0891 [Roseibaca calidilacus]